MMAGTAGFDPDHRWPELLEQNRDTGVIYPMKLKNVLRRIHSNSANLVHGRSPLFEINTRPHSGTLDAAGGRSLIASHFASSFLPARGFSVRLKRRFPAPAIHLPDIARSVGQDLARQRQPRSGLVLTEAS